MTLYWWRHWFWITSILAAVMVNPTHTLSSISDTNIKDNLNSNINSNSHMKDFKETNKYPLDNVEDLEDIINGDDFGPSHNATLELITTSDGKITNVTDIASESVIMSIPNRNRSTILSEVDVTSTPPAPAVQMDTLGSHPNLTSSTGGGEDLADKAPFTLENVHREDDLIRAESEHRSRKSKELSAEYRQSRVLNTTDGKEKLNRSLADELNVDESDGNISSEALSIESTYFLDAGSISGICLVALVVSCAAASAGVFIYRRRYNNKPQALSEPDLSVYIDDSTIRDNSDEMYSLDNDSFLNSLEAMTIQNYWTDTVKHTKL